MRGCYAISFFISTFDKMITRASIDKIFSAIRVEEVIGEYVQLKKAGSNYKGLSPFQDEKTPSFVVSPSKQIWKDFSSGKGGTAVTFLMEIENFTYPEALRYLAKKYGIEIEETHPNLSEEEKEAHSQRDLQYKIHEVANAFYQEQLHASEEGKNIGYAYFKERGLTNEIIRKFQLGYSPEQKNAFTEYALQKGYEKELLEQSGLSIFTERSPQGIDRFRERVIFPIHSFSGRVLGFGGRILKNNVKAAKYLNSPESEIYHKSKILYGIAQSKQAISKQNQCLLVEGYMDVLSFHQTEIENVVASSGTSLTKEQIKLIKRLTPNVTILFDGDAAGIKAAFRSIDMLLEENMNIKVMLFPDGHDPDSFAKAYPHDYVKDYIAEHSVDFIQFKIDILNQEVGNDPFKRSEMIKEVVQSIAFVPNALKQEVLVQEAARLLGVSEQNLFGELDVQKAKRGQASAPAQSSSEKSLQKLEPIEENTVDPLLFLEGELVDLMLKYGDKQISKSQNGTIVQTTIIEEILRHLAEDDYKIQLPLNEKIISEIREGLAQEELRNGKFFLNLMDEDLTQKVTNSLMQIHEVSDWSKHNIFFDKEEEVIEKIVHDVILRHKREYVLKIIKDLTKTLQDDTTDDYAVYDKIIKLNQLKIELDKVLFRIL